MSFELAKFWCEGQEYTVLDEHVCDQCETRKHRIVMCQLNREAYKLFASGRVRFADPKTSEIELAIPRPNKIPAPTPDKAVARCFDLED